ncbi:unnamed protein product [Prorocentrum cordatum]|uniref:Uncharacterized protein n=1 Tax=Prorocentrum cordatum TaxID=2364126 RepID=A0ABN9XTB4_9DINO|nr:unnamed protein product [Polarella glacialis]
MWKTTCWGKRASSFLPRSATPEGPSRGVLREACQNRRRGRSPTTGAQGALPDIQDVDLAVVNRQGRGCQVALRSQHGATEPRAPAPGAAGRLLLRRAAQQDGGRDAQDGPVHTWREG